MSSLRLVYGKDPWAEGEEIDLIILDRNVVDLLCQMSHARTWGEATKGSREILEEQNEVRLDRDEPPLRLDDSFDFRAELETEKGVVYVASLGLDFDSLVVDARLKAHVRFDAYFNRCWLRDDESASLALDLLREHRGEDVTLVRDDSTVGWVLEGLLG